MSKSLPVQSTPPQAYDMKQLLLHNTMFYILPPLCEISLQEMEDLACERLKMLRIFEAATAKYPVKHSDEWKQSILREMNSEGLKSYVRLLQGNSNTPTDLEARRRDYLSHFILRFAYCATDEKRRWFKTLEMDIFWFKFNNLTPKDILAFKKAYTLQMEPVSQEEKQSVLDKLLDCSSEKSTFKVEDMDYYKVKFTQVLKLVERRSCFLKLGYAYVSATEFGHIIAPKYEKFIERGLQEHAELLPQLEDDERLYSIIRDLPTSYTGKDYTVGTNDVAVEHLDQLSKKSYPLCMRVMHDTMKLNHKLKHNGRIQYQLFLKGIGLTMEDCLRFFREEFTRIMDADKFQKEYSYNIRYNYGKEGSRRNIAPYSCMKIITDSNSVAADDIHGCPFKVFANTDLRSRLTNYGLGSVHADEVTDFARKGHYQIACQRYFEIVHDTKVLEGINHPNRYFEMSQEVMGNRQPKTNAKPGQKGKALPQDIILKKKKLQNLMDEDTDELIKISQATEEGMKSQQTPKTVEIEKKNESYWDDDNDDIDYSQIDDSVAMQY